MGSASSVVKTMGKRESGSLESNNLQALAQPGQRPGSSTLFKGTDAFAKGGAVAGNNPTHSLSQHPGATDANHNMMMDRYYNRNQFEDEDGFVEDQSNNESLDAVNISTPVTYGVNHQGRPQTSHGRIRKQIAPVNGIQKREEKQTGLGETSVKNWDESKETDISKK